MISGNKNIAFCSTSEHNCFEMVNKFLFCSTFEHESFEMGLKKKRYCAVPDSELMSTEIYVHTPVSPKLEA